MYTCIRCSQGIKNLIVFSRKPPCVTRAPLRQRIAAVRSVFRILARPWIKTCKVRTNPGARNENLSVYEYTKIFNRRHAFIASVCSIQQYSRNAPKKTKLFDIYDETQYFSVPIALSLIRVNQHFLTFLDRRNT